MPGFNSYSNKSGSGGNVNPPAGTDVSFDVMRGMVPLFEDAAFGSPVYNVQDAIDLTATALSGIPAGSINLTGQSELIVSSIPSSVNHVDIFITDLTHPTLPSGNNTSLRIGAYENSTVANVLRGGCVDYDGYSAVLIPGTEQGGTTQLSALFFPSDLPSGPKSEFYISISQIKSSDGSKYWKITSTGFVSEYYVSKSFFTVTSDNSSVDSFVIYLVDNQVFGSGKAHVFWRY